jgi:hypothetical protein
MENEKKENIDELIRKGMEGPANEPVFREVDWDAMEQMLDKSKRRGIVVWLPWLGSAAALLLLFLGLWMYNRPHITKNNANQQAVRHPEKANTGTSGGATRPEMADSSKQQVLNPASYAGNPVHHGDGKKTNRSLPYSPVGAAAGLPASNSSSQPIAAAKNHPSDKKDLGTGDATNGQVLAKSPAPAPSSPDKKDLGTGDALAGQVLANNAAPSSPNPDKKDLGTGDASKNKGNGPAVKAKGTTGANMGGKPVLALTAVATTDVNGVNSFQGGKVGGNFGAMFSVGVKKWTFSTGAMYSIKPYAEEFADYHTGYKFKYPPASVAVNCRMIDIPLNVSYQVYSKNGNRFNVGTGLSSYIILREDYTFTYDNPYASGPTSHSVINKNQNILGILNLNATYEHRINSKFGVAFQPYFKLPLSNVGASQVKLQSAGVAVGLSWHLNSNSFKKPD